MHRAHTYLDIGVYFWLVQAIAAIQIRDVRNTADSIVRHKRHIETQPACNRLSTVSSKDHSTSSPSLSRAEER
jgi:hypothetical protein